MNGRWQIIADLNLRIKALERQVAAYRSGTKYQRLQKNFQRSEKNSVRQIKKLKQELARAHAHYVTMEKGWFQAYDDFERDWQRKLNRLERKLAGKDVGIARLEAQLKQFREKLTAKNAELYAVKTKLEEAQDKIKKLLAQLNRDYENSSLPSSMTVNHKKIHNSREKTDRKPGAQPSHKGHIRRRQEPTRVVQLPAPEQVQAKPELYRKEQTVSKQLVNLRIVLDVTEYRADIYRDRETGERIHAAFPAGVVNDVNYGGTVKAFAFLLNNRCNVSLDNCRGFLRDLTDGKLNLSKGMLNGLSRAFAARTEPERKQYFAELLLKPVMHADATAARYNGQNANVYVCASPDGTAMYFAREKKGHEGIKGTPVAVYQGTLVHDHDVSYYSYGTSHQECLAHVLRYLKDSMENEPERKWNKEMYDLLTRAIHLHNQLKPSKKLPVSKIKEIEAEYKKILTGAKEEYEYEPATWYRDGYNLQARLAKDPDSYLRFLHDPAVPTTNNLAERLLRLFKRKQKQAVAFRSFGAIDALCNSLSVLVMMQQNPDQSLYQQVAETFNG